MEGGVYTGKGREGFILGKGVQRLERKTTRTATKKCNESDEKTATKLSSKDNDEKKAARTATRSNDDKKQREERREYSKRSTVTRK